MTIVLSTHDMGLVWEFCNRTVVLKEGEIIFDGTPEELFSNEYIISKSKLNIPYWFEISKDISKILEKEMIVRNKEDVYELIS
ncbi:hypothetical protein [Miniphocaeibacter massiliensis]|uniref:hypothetical protein n=1 Tax=Miniphocaeibacter massiliensis TaxID=2041841 RepID=UPI000C1B8DCD|nr:hypothetical protein [Miniphocaeibacter massiliensis]